MNFPRHLLGIVCTGGSLALLAGAAHAQQKAPVMRDTATHASISQDIRNKQSSAALNSGGNQSQPKPLGVDPAKKTAPAPSGLSQSTLFASNGTWTPVPSGAVLFVPPAHQAKLVKAPAGKIVSWADFYAANRNWIIELEVRPEQAQGKVPFDQNTVNNWKLRNCVVVAVSRGNLIGVVNPPKTQ